MGLCECLLSLCWDFVWLDPVENLCILLQPPWGNRCHSPVVAVSLSPSTASDSYNCSDPLPLIFPEAWEQEVWYGCSTYSWACVVSYSLCVEQLWVSYWCWHMISLFGFLPVFSSTEFFHESGKEQGRGCCTIAMLSGLKELKIIAQEISDFLFYDNSFWKPREEFCYHLATCSYLCTNHLLGNLEILF